MERINLNNYEAFFLDYLEGNLNAQQEFELMDFIQKHPELKEELDIDLSDLQLKSDDEISMSKSALLMDISDDEIEEKMIAAIEGQLDQTELKKLDQTVASKGLDLDYLYYQNTKLVPNLNEVFDNKDQLKKKNGIIIPMFVRYAAAAAVIVIFISLFPFGNNEINNSGVAEQNDELNTLNSHDGVNPIALKSFGVDVNDSAVSSENSYGINENLIRYESNLFAEDQHEKDAIKDTSLKQIIQPDLNEDIVKKEDGIIDQKDPNDQKNPIPENIEDQIIIEEDDVAVFDPETIIEEPIKPITSVASNIFNRDIYYQREKETQTNNYVAHHFKIGRFEFERKKD
ncbi:hypothetical protein K6119_12115 [Paracrocinitomix mangrovi]|uniref:hypothetical protein n=1 Tax=Paracrocinitomix mangrovi TaxID=2862509 RepID=UPI001C8EBBB9|nr:hypothetical protein [Paracrocinitomix mangrovi]UKN00476.1 hypothetical protein K6119_12115 [Paracrocinitomix mangrovi]